MRGLYLGLAGLASIVGLSSLAWSQDNDVEAAFASMPLTAADQQKVDTAERVATDDAGFQTLDDQIIDGVKTKSELVAGYAGTDIFRDSRPVGRLMVRARLAGNMSNSENLKHLPCTAFLIDNDVAITAWHCAPGLVKSARDIGYEYESAVLEFGYTKAGSVDSYDVAYVIEQNQELDYALLQLAPKGDRLPGEIYGVYGLASAPEAAGTPLRVFHHPYGYFKMLLKDGTCQIVASRPSTPYHRLLHHCDTRGGSSGAPIVLYQYAAYFDGAVLPIAVAVNVRGMENGLGNPQQYNQGTRISAIAEQSPYLRSMMCVKEPGYGYECPRRRLKMQIRFDFDKSDLTPEAIVKLDQIVRLLNDNPSAILTAEAHTDSLNSSGYAIGLTQRMNQSVRYYLEGRGIGANRFTFMAFGSSRPLVQGERGERQPLNRRVDLIIDWNGASREIGDQ